MTKSNWLKAIGLFILPAGVVLAPVYIICTILKKEKKDAVQVQS